MLKNFKNLSLPLFLIFIIETLIHNLKDKKIKKNNLFTNSVKIRISYSNNSGKFNLIGGIYKPNKLHYSYWYSLTENYEGNNI